MLLLEYPVSFLLGLLIYLNITVSLNVCVFYCIYALITLLGVVDIDKLRKCLMSLLLCHNVTYL